MHAMNRRCAFCTFVIPSSAASFLTAWYCPFLVTLWRAVDKKVGESAEQLHWQFLKHVFGVRGNTATLIVLAEFGHYPLHFHCWQQILR